MTKILKEDEEEEDTPKKVQLKRVLLPKLEHFAIPKSRSLLQHLGIDESFLQEDPATWESNQEFQSSKMRVKNIPVVNDVAEQGVAFIEQFNSHHTTNDNQL